MKLLSPKLAQKKKDIEEKKAVNDIAQVNKLVSLELKRYDEVRKLYKEKTETIKSAYERFVNNYEEKKASLLSEMKVLEHQRDNILSGVNEEKKRLEKVDLELTMLTRELENREQKLRELEGKTKQQFNESERVLNSNLKKQSDLDDDRKRLESEFSAFKLDFNEFLSNKCKFEQILSEMNLEFEKINAEQKKESERLEKENEELDKKRKNTKDESLRLQERHKLFEIALKEARSKGIQI